MSNENVLIKSPCGEKFQIYFGNGSRSIEYDLNEDGLRFVVSLVKSGKISLPEFWKMRDKIVGEVVSSVGEKPDVFLGLLFSFFNNIDIQEIVNIYQEEKTNVAAFKVCKCGESHGRIFFNGGLTDLISSLDEAVDCLDFLSQNGLVSQDELSKVLKEVQFYFS